jgi:hypothetical protein
MTKARNVHLKAVSMGNLSLGGQGLWVFSGAALDAPCGMIL